MTDRIAVIVPVYNAADSLPACIAALQAQTDDNVEVILVDDASPDGCPALCDASGFKTIHLPYNKGQAVARNAGVAATDAPIVAFLDSDAVPPPNWVTGCRTALETYPDADMICSGYSHNLADAPAAHFAFREVEFRRARLPTYIDSSTGSNCVVRRAAFDAVGGYPEYYIDAKAGSDTAEKAVATAEDSELGFLFTQQDRKIVWSQDNPVGHYFRDTWPGYFRQQMSYSRHLMISLFRYPAKLKQGGIYASESVVPQLLAIIAMLLAPLAIVAGLPGLLAFVAIEATCVLFFRLTHRELLAHFEATLPDYSLPRAMTALIVCRFFWLSGIAVGLLEGLRMAYNQR